MSISSETSNRFLGVGIVGHRWNKIRGSEASRIERQLGNLLATVDEAARAVDEHFPVRLSSGLAEGADQLAIARRPSRWRVDAILPFPRERYREDFTAAHASDGVDRRAEFDRALTEADSIVEFPLQGDPLLGYEQAADAVLKRSDLLVAVWDGMPKAGRGGTEEAVTQAVTSGIPVFWICSEQDRGVVLLGRTIDGRARDAVPVTPELVRSLVANLVKKARPVHGAS